MTIEDQIADLLTNEGYESPIGTIQWRREVAKRIADMKVRKLLWINEDGSDAVAIVTLRELVGE